MSRSDRITITYIKSTVEKLAEQYGAERIYLFGSYARGDARPNSDVDLRIDKGNIKGFFALGGFQSELEDCLGLPVDLLPTDSLDDKFLRLIQEEEILLYGKE